MRWNPGITGTAAALVLLTACAETPTEVDSDARASVVSSGKGFQTSARGSGHYFVNEKFRNFTFTAKTDRNGDTKGSFNVVNRVNGYHVQGDIACLLVDGNQAVMAGFVTKPADGATVFQVGDNFVFAVEDNGEGKASPPDRLSAVLTVPIQQGYPTHESLVDFFCSGSVASALLILPPFNEAIAGNIQVKP